MSGLPPHCDLNITENYRLGANPTTVALCMAYTATTAVVAITGNVVVLLAIFRTPSLQVLSNYFVGCLAVANLYLCIFLLPFWVNNVKDEYNGGVLFSEGYNNWLVATVEFLAIQITVVASYSMCVITVDRMLFIKYVYKYPQLLDKSRCYLVIGFVWIVSTILALPRFFIPKYSSQTILFLAVVTIMTLPFIAICYCYYEMFKIAQSHVRRKKATTVNDTEGQASRSRKTALTIGTMIGLYTLLGIPVFILSILDFVFTWTDPCRTLELRGAWMWTQALFYSRSAYNPWIHAAKNKEFIKKEIRKIVGLRNEAEVLPNPRPVQDRVVKSAPQGTAAVTSSL